MFFLLLEQKIDYRCKNQVQLVMIWSGFLHISRVVSCFNGDSGVNKQRQFLHMVSNIEKKLIWYWWFRQ